MSELYDTIHEAFASQLPSTSEEEVWFIHRLTSIATGAATVYTQDLEEANKHLQETVKRLTKEV